MGSSYEADPEVQLMLRVKADEPGAYEDLVARIAPPLLNFMLRQTGDQQLAEDLAQEVLMRTYHARHAYRPEARFRTWLYRIGTNLALNRLRYEGYRETLSIDAARESEGARAKVDVADARAAAPDEGIERAERRERVRRAVAALPDNQRMAVLLLRFEELSYEEIAAAMDLSLQATKSLLNRAKENLRRLLAGEIDVFLASGSTAARGSHP